MGRDRADKNSAEHSQRAAGGRSYLGLDASRDALIALDLESDSNLLPPLPTLLTAFSRFPRLAQVLASLRSRPFFKQCSPWLVSTLNRSTSRLHATMEYRFVHRRCRNIYQALGLFTRRCSVKLTARARTLPSLAA